MLRQSGLFRANEEVIERMMDRARTRNEGAARYLQNVSEQEEAELDDMCEVDRFVSLVKSEVLAQTSGK